MYKSVFVYDPVDVDDDGNVWEEVTFFHDGQGTVSDAFFNIPGGSYGNDIQLYADSTGNAWSFADLQALDGNSSTNLSGLFAREPYNGPIMDAATVAAEWRGTMPLSVNAANRSDYGSVSDAKMIDAVLYESEAWVELDAMMGMDTTVYADEFGAAVTPGFLSDPNVGVSSLYIHAMDVAKSPLRVVANEAGSSYISLADALKSGDLGYKQFEPIVVGEIADPNDLDLDGLLTETVYVSPSSAYVSSSGTVVFEGSYPGFYVDLSPEHAMPIFAGETSPGGSGPSMPVFFNTSQDWSQVSFGDVMIFGPGSGPDSTSGSFDLISMASASALLQSSPSFFMIDDVNDIDGDGNRREFVEISGGSAFIHYGGYQGAFSEAFNSGTNVKVALDAAGSAITGAASVSGLDMSQLYFGLSSISGPAIINSGGDYDYDAFLNHDEFLLATTTARESAGFFIDDAHDFDGDGNTREFVSVSTFGSSASASLHTLWDSTVVLAAESSGWQTFGSLSSLLDVAYGVDASLLTYSISSLSIATDGETGRASFRTFGGETGSASFRTFMEDNNLFSASIPDSEGVTGGTATMVFGQLYEDSNLQAYHFLDLRDLSANGETYQLDMGLGDGFGVVIGRSGEHVGEVFEVSGDFDGFIIEGSDVSSLTSTPISVATSQYDNSVVIVSGGSGLDIDLGADSTDDLLSFRGSDLGVSIDLNIRDEFGAVTFSGTGTGGDSVVVGADAIGGSDISDTIIGYTDRQNVINGYDGNDTITGGDLDDILIGWGGADTITGGKGRDFIIDLGTGDTLDGGEGRDSFYLRGQDSDGNWTGATIQNFDIAPDALARGGMASDLYADRIIFSLNSAAILAAMAEAAQASERGLNDIFSEDDYDYVALTKAIDVEVEGNAAGTDWTVTASFNYTDLGGASQSLTLGLANFTTAEAYVTTNGIGSTLKATALQFSDHLHQLFNSVDQRIMDTLFAAENPAAMVEGELGGLELDGLDEVELALGIYESDAQLVEARNTDVDPVLIPILVNNVEIATRFQAMHQNEVFAGGRAGDQYEFVQSLFFESDGVTEKLDQSFGNDLILERGIRGDGSVRDVLELAEFTSGQQGSGVSVTELLVGEVPSLRLHRTESGEEGAHRSLELEYDGGAINNVSTTVYKQYYEYSDAFRVEDLQLLDIGDTGLVKQFDLGTTDADGNLLTSGGRDSILVGRSGSADVFRVDNTGVNADDSFAAYFVDWEVGDSVDLSAFVDVTAGAATLGDVTYDDDNDVTSAAVSTGSSKASLSLDLGSSETASLDLYFAGQMSDSYQVSIDDELQLTLVATALE